MAQAGRKRKETTGGAADAADLERLRRDLDAAEAERADAVRAQTDLAERRDDVLASEDVAQLEAHETAVAAVERRVAVAETKCTRLAGEIEDAEAEAEQARRRASYRQAEKALAEARAIIVEEYAPAAKALAEILRRASKLRDVVFEANKLLPADAEPLSVQLEPVFDGKLYRGLEGRTQTVEYYVNRNTGLRAGPYDCPMLHSERDKWIRHEETIELPLPRLPAVEHRSVISFTNLPGIEGPASYIYAAPFWGSPRFND